MNIWLPIFFILSIILIIVLYNFTIKKEDESNYPSLIVIFLMVCVIVFYSYFYRKDITLNYSSRFPTSKELKPFSQKREDPYKGEEMIDMKKKSKKFREKKKNRNRREKDRSKTAKKRYLEYHY